MKQEINPEDTNRAIAFELWMKSPMPMVTLTKTFDVTRLCKVSHRRGMKFNMLLCWCIGKTASRIEEFYMLPHNGKLYKYDRMAINMIVENVKGGLSFFAIPMRLQRKKKPKQLKITAWVFFWSGLLDSNQRPRAPQTCALPTALNPDH